MAAAAHRLQTAVFSACAGAMGSADAWLRNRGRSLSHFADERKTMSLKGVFASLILRVLKLAGC
ncbi:hypothetical protein [Mesorhizobium sp. BE184]|uniref:hypothetical protein n=1 Tax=Mesorhizobium sp. BE184 TaxID=2817714 RepID=UPI00285A3B7D|nr:hypothetical protein [Mesorhizobium sp. BE184]MDR7031672.1 hypothetical protein [Mesorhizobium sp. BE184]